MKVLQELFLNSSLKKMGMLYCAMIVSGCAANEAITQEPKIHDFCSYSTEEYNRIKEEIETSLTGLSRTEAGELMNGLGFSEYENIIPVPKGFENNKPIPSGRYLLGASQICPNANGNSEFWHIDLLFDQQHISKESGFYLFLSGPNFYDRNIPLKAENIIDEDDLFQAVESLATHNLTRWKDLKQHLINGGFKVAGSKIRKEADFSMLSTRALDSKEGLQISVSVDAAGNVVKVNHN